MLTTKPSAAWLASLLLATMTSIASATEQPAKIDTTACAKPEFPTRWVYEGTFGDVTLDLLVAPDGQVSESKVVESSGHLRLDAASERAARRCIFKAAMRNGQPVPGKARMRYTWVSD